MIYTPVLPLNVAGKCGNKYTISVWGFFCFVFHMSKKKSHVAHAEQDIPPIPIFLGMNQY